MTSHSPTTQQLSQSWDRSSEAYELYVHNFTSQFAVDAIAKANLTGLENVLEVAAGAGAMTLHLASEVKSVHATDFSSEMLKRLQSQLKHNQITNVITEAMDGQALTFPDESFDAVFSHLGVMLFSDRAKGFAEMYRVLKPGGQIVVTCPSEPERFQALGFFFKTIKSIVPDLLMLSEPPPIFSLGNSSRLLKEMIDNGFQSVRVESLVQEFEVQRPQDYINAIQSAIPPAIAIFESIGAEKAERVCEVLLGQLQERFGDGPVRLPTEVHIGVGTR